jgi:hypothetical protein
MKLREALETRKIKYKGSRETYKIHDPNPNVLILDKDYSYDGNGKSVLGFNLNYLDGLNEKDKNSLLQRVNKLDNEVLDIKGLKSWLRSIFKVGDYEDISKDKKILRYKELVKKFPELKKAIRRYKYVAIEGKM